MTHQTLPTPGCVRCGHPYEPLRPAAIDAAHTVLDEVSAERARQDEKWGEQNHPDGTGSVWESCSGKHAGWAKEAADDARRRCQEATSRPWGDTYALILNEEVAEAFAEEDPLRLREELIQVAAVAVAWVEAIDRRTGRAEPSDDIAREFTTDGGETYPFIESEDGDITGYGHQDKAEFAAAINRYDRECGLEVDPDEQWTEDAITHGWAAPLDEYRFQICAQTEPGAFPVTTLWGQR